MRRRSKAVRWFRATIRPSWRVDETSVSAGSAWKYLFRAVDKMGRLIDFTLSDRRKTHAAHRFLGKALKTMRNWPPILITTDKLDFNRKTIQSLQRDGRLSDDVMHRTPKYLNNIIDADHVVLRHLIRPARGLHLMKTA